MSDPYSLQSVSARHALPFLHPAQAQKEAFVNEALARLDALVHAAVLGVVSAPPASPAPGDSYVVGQSPTGDWGDSADAIATWQGDQWLLQNPTTGARLHRIDTGQAMLFDGGWRVAESPSQPDGGTVIDQEARAAIAGILNALRQLRIFPGN